MRNHETTMDQENLRLFISRTARELEQTIETREAEHLAWLILSHVTRLPVMQLRVNAAVKVPKTQMQKAEKMALALKKNVPFQYITHEAPFYGADFYVTPSVLIPRPETEELVQKAIEAARALIAARTFTAQGKSGSTATPKGGPDSLQILDIGTGSGCIAVTLARELPEAEIHAVEVSRRALSVAAKNARDLGASVQFYHADILKLSRDVNRATPATPRISPAPTPLPDTRYLSADALQTLAPGRFDMIVSNPPYVTVAQKGEMLPNVVEHEPHKALFVPDSDPLLFYRAIGRLATRWLKPGGRLLFEINETLASQTAILLSGLGYTEVSAFNDINGKARIISVLLPSNQADSE